MLVFPLFTIHYPLFSKEEKRMVTEVGHVLKVAKLADLQDKGVLNVTAGGHTLALFWHNGQAYAVDNRCPHMGFALHKGSVKDGILTCMWHYARFDLASGGTFDQWADDVPGFPLEIRNGEVWVDVGTRHDLINQQRQRLQEGLQRSLSLVIAKAVIKLLNNGDDPKEAFRIGLDFGTRYNRDGWSTGLTIHTSMLNLLPYLDEEDKPRALYHGLAAVAQDTDNTPARFIVRTLPGNTTDVATLKRWFRQFIEVRDNEGAERCIVSALRTSATQAQIADMLFSAVTDHRYIDTGHPLDFTNKALEALDIAGWENAEQVLTSLVRGYATAERMEEANSWRNPVDLVSLLEQTFAQIPAALEQGKTKQGTWQNRAALANLLLGDNAQTITSAMLEALRSGCTEEQLAGTVVYAAALRIARFHTSNEFGDWDTAHHTFTFANAVHQGMRRAPSVELLRGALDAAMSVYLDRFLNIPPAKLPEPKASHPNPTALLTELTGLLDRQQQVNQAGDLAAQYLYSKGDPHGLLAVLGRLLLREDRNFHTIQNIEAAFRQYSLLAGTPEGINVLVATTRYLAAHSPTMRSQGQTFQIANRLARGERLDEEE
jgi:nitrite reductase/ring-hydroxylating ferredoxin subunit